MQDLPRTTFAQAQEIQCTTKSVGIFKFFRSKEGKKAVMAILGPGSFFGEGCRRLHRASATTLQSTSVIRFEKTAMMRLLCEDRRLSNKSRNVGGNGRNNAFAAQRLYE